MLSPVRSPVMSFFVKKSVPSKKGVYLQIYESFYVPDKGKRNRSHKALGYVSDLKAKGIDDPVAWAKETADGLNASRDAAKGRQIGDASTSKNAGYFLAKAVFDALVLFIKEICTRNVKLTCKWPPRGGRFCF